MGKIVNDSHIVGERGVIRFHEYCNAHIPYICFREIVRNDFGIDGEVELVRQNEDGKKEMTGELLKVQIKSSFGSGYLKKRLDGSFYFTAKKVDLEYWSKYSLDVVLIIYDDETENLYAKKINKTDYLAAKKKSFPIDFSKENLLEKGKNDFVTRYSVDFKSRISFDTPEFLISNLLQIKHHPKRLYFYDSKYPTKKEIYEELQDENEAPYFTIYSNKIITGHPLLKKYQKFCDTTITDATKPAVVELLEILKTQELRRNLVELMNLIFKDFVKNKGIWYNKDYKRYYFSKPKDSSLRVIEKKSIKTGKESDKKVVTYHEYGKDKFFRHVAFEIDYIFNLSSIYLVVSPKYLFTVDGKETLKPAKITQYTNFLTSKAWNDQVQDQLFVILHFLSNSEGGIEILNTDDMKFSVSSFIPQQVRFGIPSDIPADRVSQKQLKEERAAAERARQQNIF